jgi:hypothetical protein
MGRLVRIMAVLIVGNIISGYAVEALRRRIIQNRTHGSAEALEPWEESSFERFLLKVYVLVGWWRIALEQSRRGASWRLICTDLYRTMVDPIDPNKLYQNHAYAGL